MAPTPRSRAEWSLDISSVSTLDSSLVACLGGHSAASRSFSICLMSHVVVVTRTQCNYRHNIKHWKQLYNVYNFLQGARFSPESIRSDAVSESERETSGISHA